MSVGQGRAGREVPSKEHGPGRADVCGRADLHRAYPGQWRRESGLCSACTLWKEVPQEIVEEIPEEIM